MRIRLKKLLNKHKNRIFSFIAVFACIPLFGFNAFAFTVPLNTLPVSPDSGTEYNVIFRGSVNLDVGADYDAGEFSTEFNLGKDLPNVDTVGAYLVVPCTFSFNFDAYDYYLATNFYWSNQNTLLDFSNGYVYYRTDIDNRLSLLDFSSYRTYAVDSPTIYSINTTIGRIPEEFGDRPFYFFTYSCTGDVYRSSYNEFTSFIYQVPKGTDAETVNNLIAAINNQTTTLGGKIDDTNDFIDKGNSSTSGIVSGNNSAIGQLDEVVSEYHATEQQFFDDFNTNQQAITSDIVGWSWGGLVSCANWVGDTMTDYYNNMGDFRQYIIYPLMLGIVLFFLGRGGSIIGHLFRKPTETTVNTKSVFRREGNTRYTTTTTSRQGGVWRK